MNQVRTEDRAEPVHLSAVCCDIDGVLFRGGAPVPGASDFLQELARRRVPLALLTNHAEARPSALAARVRELGYPLPRENVVTSATVVAHALRTEGVGAAYVVGGPVLKAALTRGGIAVARADEPADVVVVGFIARAASNDLAEAVRRVGGGARFIATNDDVLVPTREGFGLETGAWLALLRAAGAGTPAVLGKPAATAFAYALERLGVPARRTLMVGDTLDTDIVGANAVGMPTCRVRSGNAPSDSAADAVANMVFDDVRALAASWSVHDPFAIA
jgi:HAD superfamily hydrolase (TIGR01450 family)